MFMPSESAGALLIAASLVVIVAVALFVTAEAWAFVPAAAIVLVVQLASPIDDDPNVPNSPVKVALSWHRSAAGSCWSSWASRRRGGTSSPERSCSASPPPRCG